MTDNRLKKCIYILYPYAGMSRDNRGSKITKKNYIITDTSVPC